MSVQGNLQDAPEGRDEFSFEEVPSQDLPLAPVQVTHTQPSVLVIDPDAVSRSFIEKALFECTIEVECVQDGASAMEVLGRDLVDVLIVDSSLPDMSGVQLVRRLSQERRLAAIPVVFLTADDRLDTKIAAFRSGATDYLVKPIETGELVARVEALIQRGRKSRDLARHRSYLLAGSLTAIPLPDLISLLDMGRRTGILSIATPRSVGEVYFNNGAVVHAIFGNLAGPEAIYAMFAEGKGIFEFSPTELELAEAAWTIRASTQSLLLEAARRFDHDRKEGRALPSIGPGDLAPKDEMQRGRGRLMAIPGRTRVLPAPAPSTALLRSLEGRMGDPYLLGEFKLWNYQELAEWTQSSIGKDRLHILLLTELRTGISSMLPLAGPLSENWVMSSLTNVAKVVGLVFFLRNERVIDLVLLDVQNPTRFLPWLNRTPAAVILAPTDGDSLSLGPRGLVQLERLLSKLAPSALLGVGGPGLLAQLRALKAIQLRKINAGTSSSIAGGLLDLRGALMAAVKLWGNSTQEM